MSEWSPDLVLESIKSTGFDPDWYWKGGFEDYLRILSRYPMALASAHQRLYQAIKGHGVVRYVFAKEDMVHYQAFDDPIDGGEDAVFGQDRSLAELVRLIKAAACRYGTERRILLLHGPVGSSKSTTARMLTKLLVHHTKQDEGRVYTFSWKVGESHKDAGKIRRILGLSEGEDLARCPIHEDPIRLLPEDALSSVVNWINRQKIIDGNSERERFPEEIIEVKGEPCPYCRRVWRSLLEMHEGDWQSVLRNHILVERLIFSEGDRIGIGSFHPKDEKNQDATELSGDVNWRKLQDYGSESDPRAFDFTKGEFFVANRGLFYFEEILKLEKAFLYDLLHASQEGIVKPKGFSVVYIDTVLIGGTNNPEYERLIGDQTMEAFNDRTRLVSVPYLTQPSKEQQIYDRIYSGRQFRAGGGKHIAPHVTRITALFAVLTRIKASTEPPIDRMRKAKLYDGVTDGDGNDDLIRQLYKGADKKEGLEGASPRLMQDVIAKAITLSSDGACVVPYNVFEHLKAAVDNHALFSKAQKDDYLGILAEAKKEYERIIREEVEQAIAADDGALVELFNNYIANLRALKQFGKGARVVNPVTKLEEPYNERLMREIETKIGVGESDKDGFRLKIFESIAQYALDGKTFNAQSDERLYRALRLKLFDDRKDHIKLSTLSTRAIDPEEQAKIDVVLGRLQKMFGYCPECAKIILHAVAAIFARG